MCQNNLSDAAFSFYRVDPSNPHNPGGDSIIILDAQSGKQYVLPAVQHDARAVFLPAVQDEGLLLPAVQNEGSQSVGQNQTITVHSARTETVSLPAVQDDGLLLPAVQDQWLL